MSNYQAQVVNVNNNYQSEDNFLPFLYSVAQWSGESIVILDDDTDIIYTNNKLGTFSGARKRDTKDLDGMCRYLQHIYSNADYIHTAIEECYRDYKPRFFTGKKYSGDTVSFKVIPVLDNINFRGVIVMGNIEHAEIPGGEGCGE